MATEYILPYTAVEIEEKLEQIDNKIDVQQDVANAGKILGIGEDGVVTPMVSKSDSVEVLFEDTLVEAGKEFQHSLTQEEVDKLNSAKFIKLSAKTNSSAYILAGITFGVYRASWYGYYERIANNISLGTGNNGNQIIIAIYADYFNSNDFIKTVFTGVTGVSGNITTGMNIGLSFNKGDIVKLVTTTETGFPVGTTIKCEIVV